MQELFADVVVAGGGPAGLAAALAAKESGAPRVLVAEREARLGGILRQCIHPGFGLKQFKQEWTGPEYAHAYVSRLPEAGVDVLSDAMILSLHDDGSLVLTSPAHGLCRVRYRSLVLAMGCRERTRGALAIPGPRPAGIFTAGLAQLMINLQGRKVGSRVVILGSGDIGMIMARRLSLEGARVECVVERLPYLSGLTRNKVQCLDDFHIPLHLHHTVVDIKGRNRVEGVVIAPVDDALQPVMEKSWEVPCDTLLLSVGLIPENELSRSLGLQMDPVTGGPCVSQDMETSVSGVFACGNVVHVNDLVDNVSAEGARAGQAAALFALGRQRRGRALAVRAGEGVRYVVPQHITDTGRPVTLSLRVGAPSRDSRLMAVSGAAELWGRHCRRLSPGEMELIDLPPDTLNRAENEIMIKIAPK